MNDRIDDLLTTTLKTRAEQVEAPLSDDLTEAVLPRAHRAVRRRRAATGLGVAVLATAVAGTGWWALRGGLSDPQVAKTPTISTPSVSSSPSGTTSTPPVSSSTQPSSSSSSTTSTQPSTAPSPTSTGATLPGLPSATPAVDQPPAQVWQMVQALPQGAPINTLPRAEGVGSKVRVVLPGGTSGQRVVALPSDVGSVRQIAPAAAGWLVVTSSSSSGGGDGNPGAALYLIGADSSPRLLVKGVNTHVMVSPDGTQYAIGVDAKVPASTSSLVVGPIAQTSTPTPTELPFANLSLLGWSAEGLWFNDDSGRTMLRTADGKYRLIGRSMLQLHGTTRENPKLVSVETIGGQECLVVSQGLVSAEVVACAKHLSIDPLPNGMIVVSATQTDAREQTFTYLLDANSQELKPVKVPAVIGANPLLVPAGDADLFVFWSVSDPANGQVTWLRWTIETGAVERAPLPAGVDRALVW